jgi:hypothetical protein
MARKSRKSTANLWAPESHNMVGRPCWFSVKMTSEVEKTRPWRPEAEAMENAIQIHRTNRVYLYNPEYFSYHHG